MQKRLKEIALRLGEYSLGKFDKRISLSHQLDDIDAISSGINMLGDELKAITISRDYFTNIFNSVSDMVFIVNSKGVIEDANTASENQLNYDKGSLKNTPIKNLRIGDASYFKNIVKELKKVGPLGSHETVFFTKDGRMIPVRYNASYFKNIGRRSHSVLLTASDITFQIKTENLIIRAILDAQETERTRLAKDFHDSLTQQLSAIKFYISTTVDFTKSKHQKEALLKSMEALTEVISDIRNICFNLMPKTLEEFGLVKAVKEFCNYNLFHKSIHFTIEQKHEVPELAPVLKIDLYRVVQEFITNAVKHGKANRIHILFDFNKYGLRLKLTDNGNGFDCDKQQNGMGLRNARSRVRSHDGKIDIASIISKGTSYTITIPVKYLNL